MSTPDNPGSWSSQTQPAYYDKTTELRRTEAPKPKTAWQSRREQLKGDSFHSGTTPIEESSAPIDFRHAREASIQRWQAQSDRLQQKAGDSVIVEAPSDAVDIAPHVPRTKGPQTPPQMAGGFYRVSLLAALAVGAVVLSSDKNQNNICGLIDPICVEVPKLLEEALDQYQELLRSALR